MLIPRCVRTYGGDWDVTSPAADGRVARRFILATARCRAGAVPLRWQLAPRRPARAVPTAAAPAGCCPPLPPSLPPLLPGPAPSQLFGRPAGAPPSRLAGPSGRVSRRPAGRGNLPDSRASGSSLP